MKKIEIREYILILFRFENDKVVINDDELDKMRMSIQTALENDDFVEKEKEPTQQDGYLVFDLDREKFKNFDKKSIFSKNIAINKLKLGYYHHRSLLLAEFIIDDKLGAVRSVRGAISKLTRKIVEKYIIDSINKMVKKEEIRSDCLIKFAYSYPLIIIKNGYKLIEKNYFPFSLETETLFFEIIEPCWTKITGRTYHIRISIPSIILYTKGFPSQEILRDLINAIYQHCLYIKKLGDMNKDELNNEMDELILTDLWKHMEDTMGGRSFDVHITRLTYYSYFLSLFAIVISIISIALSFIV